MQGQLSQLQVVEEEGRAVGSGLSLAWTLKALEKEAFKLLPYTCIFGAGRGPAFILAYFHLGKNNMYFVLAISNNNKVEFLKDGHMYVYIL